MRKFNVMHFDFNSGTMKPYNIISQGLIDYLKQERKRKHITDYVSFKECLNREFRYHYWCKSECEIIVSDLSMKKDEKIDIYTQIMMNFDLICDLILQETKFKFNKK